MVSRRHLRPAAGGVTLGVLVLTLGILDADVLAQEGIRANLAAPVEAAAAGQPAAAPEPAAPAAPAPPLAVPDASIPTESVVGPAAGPDTLESQNVPARNGHASSRFAYANLPKGLPSIWRTLGSLLVVLALIVLAAYVLRRLSLGARGGPGLAGLEVLARSPISPKQSLCLVKLGSRLLLLGLSPNHMTALHAVEEPDDVAQILGALERRKPHSISNSFTRLFQREDENYADWLGEGAAAGPAQDPSPEDPAQQWTQARGELGSLLEKVKGLARIRLRR